MLAYEIGRRTARPVLECFVGSERARAPGARSRRTAGSTLLLAARLVPIVPFSLFSYRRGRCRGPARALRLDDGRRLPADHRPLPSIWEPRLDELSLTDPRIWLAVAGLLALLLLARLLKPLIEGED